MLKKLLPVLILVFLIANATALKIIYEDNTFFNNLVCCNETDCITIRDISYIDNNTVYEFNIVEISNITSCYEAGNQYDTDLSNLVLSFPKTIVVIIFAVLILLLVVYSLMRILRGKKPN